MNFFFKAKISTVWQKIKFKIYRQVEGATCQHLGVVLLIEIFKIQRNFFFYNVLLKKFYHNGCQAFLADGFAIHFAKHSKNLWNDCNLHEQTDAYNIYCLLHTYSLQEKHRVWTSEDDNFTKKLL